MATELDQSELKRLSTLLEYQILDTPSEIEYDEIIKLAAGICETPIAMINLIDRHRQWFKAKLGLNLSESPRDMAFCNYTISQKNVFVVKDLTQDSRFANNPLVLGEAKLRFYGGVSLLAPNGYAFGTLCVLDHKSRDLNAVQKEALEILSRQVVNQMEFTKSKRLLKENFDNFQSLSHKFRTQEQVLSQSTKMAALGEVAAGAAHEINNPLAIIAGRTSQILNAFERMPVDTEKIKKYLLGIGETVDRIANIVKGLRSFSGSAMNFEKRECNLKEIIEDVIHLLSERAQIENIEIMNELTSDIFIHCSDTQLSQVIINIVNNALDAVHNFDEKWIRFEVEKTDTNIFLKIIDSGKGIRTEIQDKIMQPFFTTKRPGQGAGLGLSVAKALAESEGATLSLDPRHSFTCFVLGISMPPKAL